MDEQHLSTDRVAVVTGGSSGIGRAAASRLANEGYSVWAVARRRDLLADLAAEFPSGAIMPAPTDLTRAADVDRLLKLIRLRTPEIRVLVHSAGCHSSGPVEQAPTGDLRQLYEVNVESTYRLTHNVLGLMPEQSDVVFVNSSQGLAAKAESSQYAASMHARNAIADALRAETGQRGIRVTSIHLGRTATPLLERIYAAHGWRYEPHLLLQPDEVATMIASVVDLPRTAEVTDVSMRPAIKSY